MTFVERMVAIGTLLGLALGGVVGADARYVATKDYQDFQWAVLKDQIRELRAAVARGVPGSEEDLEELLDLFCRK